MKPSRTLLITLACIGAPMLAAQEAAPAKPDRREELLAWTRSKDPVLRGEAALALARLGNPDDGARLLELAQDADSGCAARALLAVGRTAPLGFQTVLERVANDDERTALEREAALHALGAAESEDALTTIGRVFAGFDGASFERSRFRLAALISGLSRSGDRARAAWVRRLLDDAALRDPELRALIVTSLRAMESGPEREELDELLDHRLPEVRAAAAHTVAEADFDIDRDLARQLITLSTRDRSAEVRAAALGALDRRGYDPLVGPARRAILQDQPALATLGARILLRSGSDRDRKKLVQRIRKGGEAGDAMLGCWRGPCPKGLSEYAADIARNSMYAPSGRLAAIQLDLVVPDADKAFIAKDLLRTSTEQAVQRGCLELLLALDAKSDVLEDLGDLAKAETERWTARLSALSSVAPQRAEELLSAMLLLDDPAVRATALAARRAGQIVDGEDWLKPLSPDLRNLLAGTIPGS